jgi:excisionase family DNA binding protein
MPTATLPPPRSPPGFTERWASVEEVAAHVGVRKDSIYRWIERFDLPAQKIGKLWKLKISEVDAWVRAGGTASKAQARRVDAHDGVEAKPSIQSRSLGALSFTLPAAAPDERDSPGLVLIVDDEEIARDALQDALLDQGFAAICASDGAEALKLLRAPDQPKPGVILLDLGMPNMNGLQFIEEQSRDPQLATIPVVIITADRRADVAGSPVLQKPIDITKLTEAIRRMVGD